jgi:hypothetical protein
LRLTAGSAVACQFDVAPKVPGPYWTDHPARLTSLLPLLNSSMKSFFSVAPLLPPPP